VERFRSKASAADLRICAGEVALSSPISGFMNERSCIPIVVGMPKHCCPESVDEAPKTYSRRTFMKRRALLAMGAAVALAVAAISTAADAQKGARGGGGGGGGGGGVARGGGGGGGGVAMGGGGGGARIGGGGAAFVRSAPSGAFAAAPSGGQRLVQGGITAGGKRFVQGGGNIGGGHFVGRRHFRGAGFALYGAAPYYAAPYDDYAYSDCVQVRLINGFWQRVNVCDYDYDN
jgi:hypothetical protein